MGNNASLSADSAFPLEDDPESGWTVLGTGKEEFISFAPADTNAPSTDSEDESPPDGSNNNTQKCENKDNGEMEPADYEPDPHNNDEDEEDRTLFPKRKKEYEETLKAVMTNNKLNPKQEDEPSKTPASASAPCGPACSSALPSPPRTLLSSPRAPSPPRAPLPRAPSPPRTLLSSPRAPSPPRTLLSSPRAPSPPRTLLSSPRAPIPPRTLLSSPRAPIPPRAPSPPRTLLSSPRAPIPPRAPSPPRATAPAKAEASRSPLILSKEYGKITERLRDDSESDRSIIVETDSDDIQDTSDESDYDEVAEESIPPDPEIIWPLSIVGTVKVIDKAAINFAPPVNDILDWKVRLRRDKVDTVAVVLVIDNVEKLGNVTDFEFTAERRDQKTMKQTLLIEKHFHSRTLKKGYNFCGICKISEIKGNNMVFCLDKANQKKAERRVFTVVQIVPKEMNTIFFLTDDDGRRHIMLLKENDMFLEKGDTLTGVVREDRDQSDERRKKRKLPTVIDATMLKYKEGKQMDEILNEMSHNQTSMRKDVFIAALRRLSTDCDEHTNQDLLSDQIVYALGQESSFMSWRKVLTRICLAFVGNDVVKYEPALEVFHHAIRHRIGTFHAWLDILDKKPKWFVLFREAFFTLAEMQQLDIDEVDGLDSELPSGNELVSNVEDPLNNSFCKRFEELQPVRLGKPYDSYKQYLETYYNLFRADHFYEFSEALQLFLSIGKAGFSTKKASKEFDERDMSVLYGIKLHSEMTKNEGFFRKQSFVFQIVSRPRSVNSLRMTNLMPGNLLALSMDGSFTDVVWLKIEGSLELKERRKFKAIANVVLKKSETGLLPQIVLDVSLCNNTVNGVNSHVSYEKILKRIALGCESAILVEVNSLYASFGPTLQFIQKCIHDKSSISPLFQDAFALCEQPQPVSPSETEALTRFVQLHPEVYRTLDPGQKEAFDLFLKQRLTLIQGPPGTGKSFLAARIIYALIHCGMDECQRVLVVSYKNHSLDEMLKSIVELEKPKKDTDDSDDDDDNDKNKNLPLPDFVRLGSSKKMDSSLQMFCLQEMSGINVPQSLKKQKIEDKRTVEGIKNRLFYSMCALNDPIEMNETVEKEFVNVFPEFEEELNQMNVEKKQQLFKKGISALNVLISSRMFEDEETDWDLVMNQELSSIDDLEDEVDYQNTRNTRDELYEGVSSSERCDRLLTSQKRRSAPTLGDLVNAFPSSVPTIQHKWVCLPKKARSLAEVLRYFFLKKAERVTEQLHTAMQEIGPAVEKAEHSANALKGAELSTKKVVFCTVTGCSIFHEAIELFNPTAIVIEEAGEIPEPCIISCLFKSIKRVIMVGDHKQLPASVECFKMEEKNLQVSALQRLITDGFQYRTLFRQNRMLNELIWLVQPFYDRYESNMMLISKLYNKVPPSLVKTPVFWWTHKEEEINVEGGRDSHINKEEVMMTLTLCRALLSCDVDPSQVTVLTGYSGQKREIQKSLKIEARKAMSGSRMAEIECATIDEFQGNEREVIILSLVRTNKPGFMSLENRAIVSLSRQKMSLIIIGNTKVFRGIPVWKQLMKNLEERRAIGEDLVLSCPRHEKSLVKLSNTTRFDSRTMVGFCKERCGAVLDCGHTCGLKCHPREVPHERCREKITIVCDFCKAESILPCRDRNHFVCKQLVKYTCDKGHIGPVACHVLQEHKKALDEGKSSSLCKERCDKLLPCGHQCYRRCGMPCPTIGCQICVSQIQQSLKKPETDQVCQVVEKVQKERKTGGTPLRNNYIKALLVTLRSLNQTDSPFLPGPWLAGLTMIYEEDYYSFTKCDPLSEISEESDQLCRCAREVTLLAIDGLSLKVPPVFMDTPHCWLFLGLNSLLDDSGLTDVRALFRKWMKTCTPSTLSTFPKTLKKNLAEAENCLWNFLTKDRLPELERFREAPMHELADNIVHSMQASKYSVLNSDVIELGRKYGCMGKETPNMIMIRPPYEEVPKDELYLPRNAGKAFVSIDLRRADYTLLLLACPNWVGRQPTWEDFVSTVLKENGRGLSFFEGIEKLRAMRTRILGKLCHTKNVALQSHVLRMIVRAVLYNIDPDSKFEFGVSRIYRFSCDELLFECKEGKELLTLIQVKTILNDSLPSLIPLIHIEAFKLHMFPMTSSMKQIAENSSMVFGIEDDINLGNKSQFVFEGVIDEEWTHGHETPVEEKSDGVFFVRETLMNTTFAIKTLPRACLTEAVPFVVDKFKKQEYTNTMSDGLGSFRKIITQGSVDENKTNGTDTGEGKTPIEPTNPSEETEKSKREKKSRRKRGNKSATKESHLNNASPSIEKPRKKKKEKKQERGQANQANHDEDPSSSKTLISAP